MPRESTFLPLLAGIVVAVAVLASCAKPYDPFRVPRAEVRERIAAVALVPAQVPFFVQDHTEVQPVLEPLVTERLERAGLRVIPSARWLALWNQFARDVGGIYDPSTGKSDGDRFQLVREAVYRALAADHGADAVLYLTVHIVDLYITFKNVEFCGGEDRVNFPGAGYLFKSTLVRGTCLRADFYDMDQRHLYGIRYALEVIETYAEQTRAVRPRAARLRNRAVLIEAVEEVVGPFADNAGGAPASRE